MLYYFVSYEIVITFVLYNICYRDVYVSIDHCIMHTTTYTIYLIHNFINK